MKDFSLFSHCYLLSNLVKKWVAMARYLRSPIHSPFMHIYIYIYKKIWKSFNDVLFSAKIVLKTHIFCKIFRFLYRSFTSLIKSKKTSNKNQHSN